MANETPTPAEGAARIQVPDNIGRLALEPLNHAIAAGSRKALDLGIPVHQVLELSLNNLSSVIAMLEPAELRAEAMRDCIKAIPDLVRQHVDVRYTSPGGVLMPRGKGAAV